MSLTWVKEGVTYCNNSNEPTVFLDNYFWKVFLFLAIRPLESGSVYVQKSNNARLYGLNVVKFLDQ